MNRRQFLKGTVGVATGLAVVPSVLVGKEKLMPSKQDEAFARLVEIGDYGTCSGPFIQFNKVWYFSDENKILWCPVDELRSDNWRSIHLGNRDEFDFWQHDKDKLYWAGQRERWEVYAEPIGFAIAIKFDSYFV